MEDDFTINDRRMKPKLEGFFWRGGIPEMHIDDEVQNTRIGVFPWWRADHGLNRFSLERRRGSKESVGVPNRGDISSLDNVGCSTPGT